MYGHANLLTQKYTIPSRTRRLNPWTYARGLLREICYEKPTGFSVVREERFSADRKTEYENPLEGYKLIPSQKAVEDWKDIIKRAASNKQLTL